MPGPNDCIQNDSDDSYDVRLTYLTIGYQLFDLIGLLISELQSGTCKDTTTCHTAVEICNALQDLNQRLHTPSGNDYYAQNSAISGIMHDVYCALDTLVYIDLKSGLSVEDFAEGSMDWLMLYVDIFKYIELSGPNDLGPAINTGNNVFSPLPSQGGAPKRESLARKKSIVNLMTKKKK